MNLTISPAAQAAALAAVIALAEAGAAARVRIYSGPQPANPSVAPGGSNTLLAEVTLPEPAFAQQPGADSAGLASTPAAALAVATGTAAWFRLVDGNGVGVADGPAGVGSSFALRLNTTNFVVGVQVSLSSLTLRVPPLG